MRLKQSCMKLAVLSGRLSLFFMLRLFPGISVVDLKYLSRMRERGDYIVVDMNEMSDYNFKDEDERLLVLKLDKVKDGNYQEAFDTFFNSCRLY